jgi:hypothetical protein
LVHREVWDVSDTGRCGVLLGGVRNYSLLPSWERLPTRGGLSGEMNSNLPMPARAAVPLPATVLLPVATGCAVLPTTVALVAGLVAGFGAGFVSGFGAGFVSGLAAGLAAGIVIFIVAFAGVAIKASSLLPSWERLPTRGGLSGEMNSNLPMPARAAVPLPTTVLLPVATGCAVLPTTVALVAGLVAGLVSGFAAGLASGLAAGLVAGLAATVVAAVVAAVVFAAGFVGEARVTRPAEVDAGPTATSKMATKAAAANAVAITRLIMN